VEFALLIQAQRDFRFAAIPPIAMPTAHRIGAQGISTRYSRAVAPYRELQRENRVTHSAYFRCLAQRQIHIWLISDAQQLHIATLIHEGMTDENEKQKARNDLGRHSLEHLRRQMATARRGIQATPQQQPVVRTWPTKSGRHRYAGGGSG
jgi:hypothetical protein